MSHRELSRGRSDAALAVYGRVMGWQLVLVLAVLTMAVGNYLDIASEDGELVPKRRKRR